MEQIPTVIVFCSKTGFFFFPFVRSSFSLRPPIRCLHVHTIFQAGVEKAQLHAELWHLFEANSWAFNRSGVILIDTFFPRPPTPITHHTHIPCIPILTFWSFLLSFDCDDQSVAVCERGSDEQRRWCAVWCCGERAGPRPRPAPAPRPHRSWATQRCSLSIRFIRFLRSQG